jgi:hypothetical protein
MNATSIDTILTEGMIIRTKLGQGSTWFENIVYKCNGGQVVLSLLKNYLENTVMPGSSITLKHSIQYYEYLFEGTVTDINPVYPSSITVQINKCEELINTRSYPRFETNLPSLISPEHDEKGYFSVVTNISMGGTAFFSKHQFDYGEQCGVSIYLPGNIVICAKGKTIRRTRKYDYYDYSMQFTDIDEDAKSTISQYIHSIQQNWDKLKNDYFNNIRDKLY